MSNFRKTLAALAIFCAASLTFTPIAAQDSERTVITPVRDRDVVTLDPAKAYILVESPGQNVFSFVYQATEEQRADWARQRSEALAEAIEKYPRALSRYQRNLDTWLAGTQTFRRPVAPVEPTETTFDWPDLDSRNVVNIGFQNRFAKSDEASLWLYEVPPGDYVFYGAGMVNLMDCVCMGTVSFHADAGRVAAMRIGTQLIDAQGNLVDTVPSGSNSTDLATRRAIYIDPPSPAAYDPRIPRDMIMAADFTPVQRMPNWFGGTINRVLPIAGVLGYDRDRMIDLRQGR